MKYTLSPQRPFCRTVVGELPHRGSHGQYLRSARRDRRSIEQPPVPCSRSRFWTGGEYLTEATGPISLWYTTDKVFALTLTGDSSFRVVGRAGSSFGIADVEDGGGLSNWRRASAEARRSSLFFTSAAALSSSRLKPVLERMMSMLSLETWRKRYSCVRRRIFSSYASSDLNLLLRNAR